MPLFCPFSPKAVLFYVSNIEPLYVMQKKTAYLITFSNFDAHTSPLFANLNLLQLHGHIKVQALFFMYQFVTHTLPNIIDSFVIKLKHNVSTCFAMIV